MNGIFGLVNLLLEMDLDPVQREYLETIHASSESLLNILDDILDYAKLNANQVNLRSREFDINKLIRDVLLVYQPTAEGKSIRLSAMICETLPDRFLADDLRLKQILSNLISNAIKFTDEGEVGVTVQPIAKSGRNQLLFQIRDSGIGISAKAGKTLFSPFRQVEHEVECQYEGTGLGLAISRNLVELMGGQIWFESENGKGTTFFFAIDFDLPEAPAVEAPDFVSRGRLGDPRDRAASPNDKVRVLLVEDNKVNQKVASLTLEQLGCDVTIANHGREAVDLADGPIRFDLICMDVNMPVMNGIEAARAIRSLDHENASSRILAMTGMAFQEDRENCLAAGMNEVITKPFEINDLRKEVDTLRNDQSESVALPS
jgi:CheY-like chemotaxis protein